MFDAAVWHSGGLSHVAGDGSTMSGAHSQDRPGAVRGSKAD